MHVRVEGNGEDYDDEEEEEDDDDEDDGAGVSRNSLTLQRDLRRSLEVQP